MGVPVVSTKISAIPEAIDEEKSGMLVAPKDPVAMAESIKRLLIDKRLRNQIIEAARKDVASRFDNRKLIGDLVAVYRNSVPDFNHLSALKPSNDLTQIQAS